MALKQYLKETQVHISNGYKGQEDGDTYGGDSEALGGMHIGNSQGCKKLRICGEKVLIFNNVP